MQIMRLRAVEAGRYSVCFTLMPTLSTSLEDVDQNSLFSIQAFQWDPIPLTAENWGFEAHFLYYCIECAGVRDDLAMILSTIRVDVGGLAAFNKPRWTLCVQVPLKYPCL